MTPRDDYAFVGSRPLFMPVATEAHVSCPFPLMYPPFLNRKELKRIERKGIEEVTRKGYRKV